MNKIFIFANPFGYGPSGKAISLAHFLSKKLTTTKIYMCGGSHLASILDKNLNYLEVNERDQQAISNLLINTDGKKFIFSSQNRFAIKAGLEQNIPTAFLDGLSWFWRTIPDDHFIADIIFWLNYPETTEKIPKEFANKIFLIEGISDVQKYKEKNKNSNEIIIYLGGCKNPLTELPKSYLDLGAKLFESIMKISEINESITFSTDSESAHYLKKYPNVYKKIKSFEHSTFLQKIAKSHKFIGNGGQTATMEAASLNANISFFLPINLSQLALIKKLNKLDYYPNLSWDKYVELPENIWDYEEKNAIIFFDSMSEKILSDTKLFNKLSSDFLELVNSKTKKNENHLLKKIGHFGVENIYFILKEKWQI